MVDTFNHAQIQQIKHAMRDVLIDELGENYKKRFNKIENNTDRACKIAKDTREEQVLIEAKVNRHNQEIKELQEFTGFATT